MDDGILDVSLLPAWSPSSVRAALTAALSRSTRLQAGIGYWTIDSAQRWNLRDIVLVQSSAGLVSAADTNSL